MPRFLYALIAFALIVLAVLPAPSFVTLAQTVPNLHLPLVMRGGDSLPTSAPTPTATPRVRMTPLPIPTPTRIPPTPTLTATNTPGPTDTPVPSGDVVVLSSTAFVPYEGSGGLYIVGEVQNLTTANAGLIRINAVLRDSNGLILTGTDGYALINTLVPDMISPFRIIFLEAPESWASYELTVTWDTFGTDPIGLDIVSHEGYFGQLDSFRVRGTVRNQTGEARDFVQVVVTAYNADGQVVGADASFTNPTTLQPGQQVAYDVEMYFWAGKPDRSQVALYKVAAYDD